MIAETILINKFGFTKKNNIFTKVDFLPPMTPILFTLYDDNKMDITSWFGTITGEDITTEKELAELIEEVTNFTQK